MPTSEIVASYTPVITKGGVFQATFTFTDEDGNPDDLLSASFDVTPNGSAPFSWTQGNGKFINVTTGVYLLDLTEVDTAALAWVSGSYVISVVENSGDVNPCVIEGLIFAKNC